MQEKSVNEGKLTQIKLTFSWQTVVYLETHHFLVKHKVVKFHFLEIFFANNKNSKRC